MLSISLQMAKKGTITIPKSLRNSYGMQPGDTFTLIDLGGIFVLNPKQSEIDTIADKISKQWAKDGETPETMILALKEEREQRAG